MDLSPVNLIDAMELMDTAQIDELTAQLENRIKENPKDLRSLLMLGNGYYLRGKISLAIQTYEKAVAVNPRLPYAHYYLGVSHYRGAHLDEAIRALEKVVELSSSIIMGYYWLGIAYYHKGLYKKSREAFEILIKQNAEMVIAHYHAALACIADRAFEYALIHLQALSDLGNSDPQVQLLLGQVYYRLNRIPEAIAAYKTGLDKSPQDHLLRDALSYLTEVEEP